MLNFKGLRGQDQDRGSWTWTSADQALSLGLKSGHINTLQ